MREGRKECNKSYDIYQILYLSFYYTLHRRDKIKRPTKKFYHNTICYTPPKSILLLSERTEKSKNSRRPDLSQKNSSLSPRNSRKIKSMIKK